MSTKLLLAQDILNKLKCPITDFETAELVLKEAEALAKLIEKEQENVQ